MKRFLNYLLLFFVLTSCDSDSAWDCVKAAGAVVQEEILTAEFAIIDVRHRVQLIVAQGDEQKVILETGKNLRKKIDVTVTDGILRIDNRNSCNLVRDYGLTKIFVTSPNITQIRNGSGLTVKSEGVLSFPNLTLLSEDTNIEEDVHNVGNFELQLDVENLQIVANGGSVFYISGTAAQANLGFYSGNGRFEGAGFIVEEMYVYHRSSNMLIVNPQQSLTGQIRSTGDLIALNQPPFVDVVEFYTGKLIFQ